MEIRVTLLLLLSYLFHLVTSDNEDIYEIQEDVFSCNGKLNFIPFLGQEIT